MAQEQATPGAAALPRPPVLVAILDSGATIHVVSDPRFLVNIRRLRSPMGITVADGRAVYASAIGDIDMEHIKLKDVYLAPDFKMNLVSVVELAKTGISTTFNLDHAVLRKGEEVVGRGIVEGELYRLTSLRATADDASDPTPEVPSGSEPGMVAAIRTSGEQNRMPGDARHTRQTCLVLNQTANLDHTPYFRMYPFAGLECLYSAFPKPEYIQDPSLASKFYQSDKTGGGVCCSNKFRDGSVCVKAHMGPHL